MLDISPDVITFSTVALPVPDSYINLIRFFIASYCSSFFSSAASRSACAWIIASPVLISLSSSSFAFWINVSNCVWRLESSLSASVFWFFKFSASSAGFANTGVTANEQAKAAVRNVLCTFFNLILPPFLILLSISPHNSIIQHNRPLFNKLN